MGVLMDIVTLCGGLSTERDVSITGGALAAAALRRRGHRVVLADLLFGYSEPYGDAKEIFAREHAFNAAVIGETAPDINAILKERGDNSRIGGNIPEICRAADIVFIALHGEDGEDGKIQAMLDLLGVKIHRHRRSWKCACYEQSGVKAALHTQRHKNSARHSCQQTDKTLRRRRIPMCSKTMLWRFVGRGNCSEIA